MPITEQRLLGLIAAGEDALRGLIRVEALVKRELALGLPSEQTLENLVLFLQTDLLLEHPVETRVTLAGERQKMSPTRLGANRRARDRQRRLRHGGKKIAELLQTLSVVEEDDE